MSSLPQSFLREFSFTLNFVIFRTKSYGIGSSIGNWIVPLPPLYFDNSFLNASLPEEVEKNEMWSLNAAKCTRLPFQLESRYSIANRFFGFRRRFSNCLSESFQDLLDIIWERGNVFVDGFGLLATRDHICFTHPCVKSCLRLPEMIAHNISTPSLKYFVFVEELEAVCATNFAGETLWTRCRSLFFLFNFKFSRFALISFQ